MAGFWAGWSSCEEIRRAAGGRFWWSRGRRKGEQQKGRARFGFIGTRDSVEVKGWESSRAARLRSAGGAGVSSEHAWRLFGLGGATWREWGRPAQGPERQQRGREGHVEGLRAARGQRTWLARAAVARGRETEERGKEVEEGGPSCKMQKIQGLH
jgi:hypothetical protein